MMNRRKYLLAGLAIAACLAATSFASQASDWPSRSITLVVPLAPGGSTDATARLLAEHLRKELGQQVVVENRAGAGGNIGAASVAKAVPDGYTLLMATNTLATNVTLYKDMGFNLAEDLVPISQVALIPNVLVVNNDVPARTLKEFINYAREQKDSVQYGSAGTGTSSHLTGALFGSMAQAEMLHIPYKGGAPANTDLIGGQIQAVFAPMVEVLPYIESGKLHALGVTTKNRSPRLPEVPAIGEALPGFEFVLWNGVFAPVDTPPDIVDELAKIVGKVMQEPAMRKQLSDLGSTPVGNTPAEFKKILQSEIEKSAELVKLSGARVD
ncbi:Bug family tripartite tricarboxylate transporter substrate binding protein [Sinorhizobium fredii]|uniref:Tripartite tricarboxylate transporter substrate binding protein n=2 Tax=Rhizobium fredii TaxID=380 RepID=A0A2A6LP05_RHIFR|nr:tripartite tricarboxylate transporter substrate binding protein [Sinorhizobium fredii]ASY70148.1 Tricarboxylate transport protein TctC [Sinorhizobium fredii CCBAU 83666]PDT44040.1 tripartite tricarboxylate transporter substrate binding protein [Sinorhizobium fredii]